ncbi:MAG TPA: phosphoribosylformylglycinamidine synthase subunit PurS [Candidatus Dormibacteraeota bacterium]
MTPTWLARVIVTPKPVVNDPQGVTVAQGLRTLGFDEVSTVRVGKYIEIQVGAGNKREARERIEEMCRKLLANHVIEDYRFEVEEVPPHETGLAGTPVEQPAPAEVPSG